MNKIALKKIGFVEQNEVDDTWTQPSGPTPNDRSGNDPVLQNGHWFAAIDQADAQLTESLEVDGNGSRWHQRLSFRVATEADRAMAAKYANRPLVIHVVTVDGNEYRIGTKSYPAYLVPTKTNSMQTIEASIAVDYDTLSPLIV